MLSPIRRLQQHPIVQRLSSSPHLSWFAPAFIVDWIVVLVILPQISTYIEHTYPFKRDIKQYASISFSTSTSAAPLTPSVPRCSYLGNPDNSWPHISPEQVPGEMLHRIGFLAPLAVMVVVSGARKSLHELHHSALALAGASAIMVRAKVGILHTVCSR